MTASSDLRIGDAERDATIDLLGRHFVDGRLTRLEHEERTEAALRARTQTQLDALLADLPDLDRPRGDQAPVPARLGPPWSTPWLWPLPLLVMVLFVVGAAAHGAPPVLPLLVLAVVVVRMGRRRGAARAHGYSPHRHGWTEHRHH